MDTNDVVRQVFGAVLRQLRMQAGLSLRELGERSLYDYSRISRVERGEHLIDPKHVPALDRALDAGGLLTLLRSLASDQAQPVSYNTGRLTGALQVDGIDSVKLELRTPDGRAVRVNLSRRELARLLAGGALSAVLPSETLEFNDRSRIAKAFTEPHHVDPELLRYFTALLEQHFTADRMLGPRHLVGPVLAQIDVLQRLHQHTRPGTAKATLRLLAQYGEFAGWLHQDLGDIAAAMQWSDRATQWAQAAGDYQLVAYLLVRKSNIALLDSDPPTVIELAAAARMVPGPVSPRLHALAAQQEARGWALCRNIDQFRRHLDEAATLLRDHPHDLDATAPVYLHSYNHDTLDEQSATGFRACGLAATAVDILERRIATTPDHLRRDHGHQVVKLANTLLATQQPDPERAAALGLQCVALAMSTGSARIRKELRTLELALTQRWPTLPGTRELQEALHAA